MEILEEFEKNWKPKPSTKKGRRSSKLGQQPKMTTSASDDARTSEGGALSEKIHGLTLVVSITIHAVLSTFGEFIISTVL